MELNEAYRTKRTELTLEKKVKLPPKKLKHIFKPVYKREQFKIKIGKLTVSDSLDAQKFSYDLKPEKIEDNLKFLAWCAIRLIKNADPYFEKSVDEMLEMFCKETIEEIREVLTNSEPLEKDKKKELTMQGVL